MGTGALDGFEGFAVAFEADVGLDEIGVDAGGFVLEFLAAIVGGCPLAGLVESLKGKFVGIDGFCPVAFLEMEVAEVTASFETFEWEGFGLINF